MVACSFHRSGSENGQPSDPFSRVSSKQPDFIFRPSMDQHPGFWFVGNQDIVGLGFGNALFEYSPSL